MQRARLTGLSGFLLLTLAGCGGSKVDLQSIEGKIENLASAVDALPKEPGLSSTADWRGELRQLSAKIDAIAARLPAARETAPVDPSKLKRESTTDLAWLLVTNDPKEKASLVCRRIEQSKAQTSLTSKNVQAVVAEVEALNVILNAAEGLDLASLQQVETARNRLVGLLKEGVPRIVVEIDTNATKTPYKTAKELWSQSSAILGFYPASNDPEEAGRIQAMVTAHDMVRSRLELAQHQRYNLWACQQIRKAWKDFEEKSDPEFRTKTCLRFVGPIHSGLLEPVTLELYRDFLQTIRGKLSKEQYQDLSEELAVHTRQLLADLQEDN